MTAILRLEGVRAHNPMGLLVALGTLDLLAEHVDPGARLAWIGDATGHCAAVQAAGCSTIADLAAGLLGAIEAQPLDQLKAVAADLNKVARDDLHGALAGSTAPRLLGGLCAEAPLRRTGQVGMTPLVITSFKGRRSVFDTLLRADAALTGRQLLALLNEPWTYAPNVATLGLDPAAREQDSARMAADASADGTRGVPGALPIAARGLVLLPPLPVRSSSARRPRVAAVQAGSLVWPIWTAALTRFGVGTLLGRSWGKLADRAIVLDACDVEAVYASEIVAAKDGRRLARARRLA